MAGAANNAEMQELEAVPRDHVELAAAKLYGQGYSRFQIARILVNHLIPKTELAQSASHQEKVTLAGKKLRRWERRMDFRDLVYSNSLVELDMQTPLILRGIASKAKRGRVDAARLALEMTGRHNPKGEAGPTTVNLVLNGIPRPGTITDPAPQPTVVEGEVLAEEDEDV